MDLHLQQTRKLFFKKTRKGKVVQPVQEKYFHADLGCGFLSGSSSSVSPSKLRDMVEQAPHKQLLVIDTNIAMHQIDVLEYNCPATSLLVILQTVLQELKHLNNSVYLRLLELVKDCSRSFIFYPNEASSSTSTFRNKGETINDANDKAIVVAAGYFQTILAESNSGNVVFITNDVKNKERAIAQNLNSMSMRQYVSKYVTQYPELLDLVAADGTAMDVDSGGSQPRLLYPIHLSMHELMEGLKARRLLKGILRCERENYMDCYAVVHSADGVSRRSVQIKGSQRVNRAVDGDVVAIELVAGPPTAAELALDAPEDVNYITDSSSAGVKEDTALPTVEEIEGISTPATGSAAPMAFGLFCSHKGSEQLYGRVVGVIRRNWRQYAGSLECTFTASTLNTAAMDIAGDETESSASVFSSTQLFVPVNKRIPKVLISTRRGEELAKSRLLVAIDQWPADSPYPQGHYVRVLGEAGNKEVETQVLLHEFDVPNEAFSAEVMACLPPGDWQITEDVVAQRTDLRHLPVVSIDPPGCKDIDDALHCLRLPNGRLEAGVHIADVTYFVHPDTPIDKEAAHRSTSTYLVERRLDMLPSLLTTQLCSLRSKEDHLAFSVIWEMDDDANIYDVRFCKSVIHSVASLTYDEAQVMLDSPAPKDKVNHSVNLLNKLARILRQRRIDMGALTLASPEVRFKLDSETQNPTDVAMYNLKESNALVEEWMLLANITVSKQILKFYPTLGILRRHQPPSREQFGPLVSSALAVGVDLDISSSKTLADSLDRAVRQDDPYFNKLLRILSTRCMMPAQYFCSGEIPKDQWHHYGLAAPVYTHFTSPIRRYADVLVHRLLAATIGVISLPASNADRSKQQELCTHMNRRHRAAQYAQRASVNINTISYFRQRPAQMEAAYVLAVKEDSFTVLVPRFGIEGTLRWDDIMTALDCDSMDFDSAAHAATLMRPSSIPAKNNRSNKKPKKEENISAAGIHSDSTAEVALCLKVFDRVHISIKVDEGSGNGGDRKLVIGLVHQDQDLAEVLRTKPRKTSLKVEVSNH